MTSHFCRARCFAALAVLVVAPVLVGCASIAFPASPVASGAVPSVSAFPSVTPTSPVALPAPTFPGKLSDAEYLARVQSYGLFSQATAATLPASTVRLCSALAAAPGQFEMYSALDLVAKGAQITPAQVRDLMTLITEQSCPELSAGLAALPVRTG